MLLQRADPTLFHPLLHCMPMSFAPPMRSVPGHHRISGHGRCSARHPCRIQPSKYVHGQKGEAKAAKSKNGHAGWNPGNARPVRYGANQSALLQGAAVYLPKKMVPTPSHTLSYI